MKDDKDIKYTAAERLTQILVAAATDANQRTLFAAVSELGLTHLGGLLVPEFHEAARQREAERLLASASDHNPELVTAMKQLWEQLKDKQKTKLDETHE
jgi:hypothetical protein